MTASPPTRGPLRTDPAETVVRVLVMEWPAWALVAASAVPGASSAVIHANRVLAVSPEASAEGVAIGMRRREAQRTSPTLHVYDHDPERDMRAFEPVVRALNSVTALVEVDRAGRCTFATRGPSRYHGGDEALADLTMQVVCHAAPAKAIAIAGRPSIGVADGSFTARLAARAAVNAPYRYIVEANGSARFLSTRPVSVLVGELEDVAVPAKQRPDDLPLLLERLGLRTLGAVASVPFSDMLARFGPRGSDAHRLACGLDRRPPLATELPPDLAVEHNFDEPVLTSGPVAFVGKQLGEELLERLAANGLACAQILVAAETDNGERSERLWRHEPAFTATTVAERVRWQMDSGRHWSHAVTPNSPNSPAVGVGAIGAVGQVGSRPTAGIVRLVVRPTEVLLANGVQRGLWGGRTDADDRAQRAVARLVGIFGPDAVEVPEWQGGRHPADSVALVPAISASAQTRPITAAAWPGRLPDPSPATVYVEPLRAELIDNAGRTLRVGGRGLANAAPARVVVAGTSHAVVGWSAPWPVEERWWDPERSRRCARFQILTESGNAHLLVVENGHWAVLATYD